MKLRVITRNTIAYADKHFNRLEHSLAPSVQSYFMPSQSCQTVLNTFGFKRSHDTGKRYCKYADSKISAYLRSKYVAENKEVPDRNIGVCNLLNIEGKYELKVQPIEWQHVLDEQNRVALDRVKILK